MKKFWQKYKERILAALFVILGIGGYDTVKTLSEAPETPQTEESVDNPADLWKYAVYAYWQVEATAFPSPDKVLSRHVVYNDTPMERKEFEDRIKPPFEGYGFLKVDDIEILHEGDPETDGPPVDDNEQSQDDEEIEENTPDGDE